MEPFASIRSICDAKTVGVNDQTVLVRPKETELSFEHPFVPSLREESVEVTNENPATARVIMGSLKVQHGELWVQVPNRPRIGNVTIVLTPCRIIFRETKLRLL